MYNIDCLFSRSVYFYNINSYFMNKDHPNPQPSPEKIKKLLFFISGKNLIFTLN